MKCHQSKYPIYRTLAWMG